MGHGGEIARKGMLRLRSEAHAGVRRNGKALICHLRRAGVKPVIAALRDAFWARPPEL